MKKQRSKFKLYLCDEEGQYNGFEPQKVVIKDGILKVGRRLTVKLSEIVSCELKKIKRVKGEYVEIIICSPEVNEGQFTPLLLLHQHFLTGFTKSKMMTDFVSAVQELIKDNNIDELIKNAEKALEEIEIPDGVFLTSYTLNVSFLIALFRKQWYAYDSAKKIIFKTYFLIFLGAIINITGVLIIAVPFDNWTMARNIEKVTGSKTHRLLIYFISISIPLGFWSWIIMRELMK